MFYEVEIIMFVNIYSSICQLCKYSYIYTSNVVRSNSTQFNFKKTQNSLKMERGHDIFGLTHQHFRTEIMDHTFRLNFFSSSTQACQTSYVISKSIII